MNLTELHRDIAFQGPSRHNDDERIYKSNSIIFDKIGCTIHCLKSLTAARYGTVHHFFEHTFFVPTTTAFLRFQEKNTSLETMNGATTNNSAPWLLRILLAVAVGVSTLSPTESWSPTPKNHRGVGRVDENDAITGIRAGADPAVSSSRRQLFQRSAAAVAAALVAAPSGAGAACLQGDTRPVCIGIYKVPLDDNILPYISTPEELHKFAPDLNYVPPIEYPASFESAMSMLKTQRLAADEIRKHVMAGKLEEAGIGVLGLIPKVTSGCRRVFADLETTIRTKGLVAGGKPGADQTVTLVAATASANDDPYGDRDGEDDEVTVVEALAIEMAENQMNYVTGYWGDCDITIGQGIRGELGQLTVAQLAILSSLRDATGALDDFLVTAETLSGTETIA